MEFVDQIITQVVELPVWAAWVAIILATFVSEDLTCIAAGLIAASGQLPAFDAIGAAGLGIFLGDLGLYAAGKWIGRPALRRAPISWFVHDDDVRVSSDWFVHRGPIVILLGRFVPGSRLPTYFAAGMLQTGFWRFTLYAALAVAIWAPLLGGGAMLLGREVLPLIELYELWLLPALVALVALVYLAFKFIIPAFTWRGRRMIVSRWRRMTRWEFWPAWIFYTPVLLNYFRLALRYRSWSVFTAVNPCMPAGGFIGESKSEILDGIEGHEEFITRTHCLEAALPPQQRIDAALDFMEQEQLDYPVVLKPDAGQRGSGVAVVRSNDELEAYLKVIRVDCVIQEHAEGEEFGLFYYRFPDEPRGRLFSITTKAFPEVVGDGVTTLERLILFDERAVCLARLHLDAQAHRLWDVPAKGERVRLVEIGNHSRGSIFYDGSDLITPELEATVDRISQDLPGFFFGRYDVIAASTEDLRAGRNFKIIELNGGTSEATSIYDPANRLSEAYRVLFEQWGLLFEIARRNAERGAETVGLVALLKSLALYRREQRSHPG